MKQAIENYIEKFGENPNIIGLFWYDKNQIIENIKNAIKTGKKYDELDLLTDSQKKLYNSGKLFF